MNEAMRRNAQFRQVLVQMVATGNVAFAFRDPLQGSDELLKMGVVDKASCVAAKDAPGHVCDFRWGPKGPDGVVRYGSPTKGRFFKTGADWQVDLPD